MEQREVVKSLFEIAGDSFRLAHRLQDVLGAGDVPAVHAIGEKAEALIGEILGLDGWGDRIVEVVSEISSGKKSLDEAVASFMQAIDKAKVRE